MTNCPNCGAPIKSNTCEYCGTVFSKSKPVVFYADNIAYYATESDQPEVLTTCDINSMTITNIAGYVPHNNLNKKHEAYKKPDEQIC